MTQAGTIVCRPDKPIKVELTDNCNLKLTDELLNTHIFINLSDAEVNQFSEKILALAVKQGILRLLPKEKNHG